MERPVVDTVRAESRERDGASADDAVRLGSGDNVAVALRALPAAAPLPGCSARTAGPVPAGHKAAVRAIAAGQPVVKYGQIIGFADRAIAAGEHVHVHNLSMGDFDRDYAFGADARPTDYVPEADRATFQGYVRQDGSVGTRNYLGLVTSVNCSATVARHIARQVEKSGILDDYPGVDGVVPIVHGSGCCMASQGETFETIQRTIWGFARHPNFAGVLLLGLGCEVNQIPRMLQDYGITPGERLKPMIIQEEGGTRRTVDEGVAWVEAMLPVAQAARRQAVPVSALTVALQCGGSDGYSGITANPALGKAVDLVVRHGGSAILSETPEIYGSEHLLTRRAASQTVGEKLIERIRWWEDYTARNNAAMDNNPTPGNKAGGLTTILEKSLGAAAKGGSTNLVDVVRYAEPVTVKGFNFMDSPGYDPCSITGQVAGGANVICFTTGRGSVYGNKPVPSIKLATNSDMYQRMAEDMDIDCGGAATGRTTLDALGQTIFDSILHTASGRKTKSEELDFGDNEFVPWHIGAQI